jgi:O-antigen/teichoic acid export membrane protein
MAGPLYPVVTGMHALGAGERIQNVYLRGGRIALWVTLVAGLPAMIYAEPIIRLYAGQAYLEAAVVMVLTLACLILTSGVWMMWQVANATGRIRATGLYVAVTQPLVVVLAFYAVKVLGWGASGVALAGFAVSAVSAVVLLWPLGLRLADVTFGAWTRQTLIPGLTPGCVAAVVWAALAVIVKPEGWVSLGLCMMAGVLCYLAVLLEFCLEPRDREDLTKGISRLRNLTRSYLGVPRQVRLQSAASAEFGCRPAVPEGRREG